MTLGEKIAAARKKKGWTQTRLAGELGVSSEVVSKWERDFYSPNEWNAEKLKRAAKEVERACNTEWNGFVEEQIGSTRSILHTGITDWRMRCSSRQDGSFRTISYINAANMPGYGPPQGASITESRVKKACGLKMR